MFSWIVANMDSLLIVVVIILTVFSILKQRKPDVVNPDGTITPGGIDIVQAIILARQAVRSARALFSSNEERFEYAVSQLESFFPGLDLDQLELFVEGAWDWVKRMDAGLSGASPVSVSENADYSEVDASGEMPIQVNGVGSASVTSFGK